MRHPASPRPFRRQASGRTPSAPPAARPSARTASLGDAGMLACWHTGRPSGGSSSSPEASSPEMLAYWHAGIPDVCPEISSRSRSPPGEMPACWHTGRPSGEPPSVPEVFPGDAGILAYRHTGRPSGGSSSSPEASFWDAGMLAPGCWHTGSPPGGIPPTMPACPPSVRGASSRIAGLSSGRSLPRSPLGPIRLDL
jgi:hypothetical protein